MKVWASPPTLKPATVATSDRFTPLPRGPVSTEAASLVEPTVADMASLLALSQAAHWNQTPDDWAWMLANGRTRALQQADTLVASTLVLPWPPADSARRVDETVSSSLAWISMVLVLPEHRGHGHATRLLQESLAWLAQSPQQHLLPVLDATPAGRPVYMKLGFSDAWSFTRWEHRTRLRSVAPKAAKDLLEVGGTEASHPIRGALCKLDCQAFGANRHKLLDDLIRRAPTLAMALGEPHAIRGFMLARPGRVATQLGPLVARDAATARELVDQALARVDGPVFIDIPDSRRELADYLVTRGFSAQRPFTRMALGRNTRSLDRECSATVWAVAGPELG